MPSPLTGMAAGVGDPVRDILNRMVAEQQMEEHRRQLEEQARHNQATESLTGRQIDETGKLREATQAATEANRATIESDKQDASARSRLAMRTPGVYITPEEKTKDRGQAPASAYTHEAASPFGPGEDIGPSPERYVWQGTEQQQQAEARGNAEDKALVRDSAGNYVPRSAAREAYTNGAPIQGYTPPDRTVVPTNEGFVPRSKVAAAAEKGTPMQPKDPAQVINRRDMATAVGSHFDDANSLLQEAESKGYLGPLKGRTYGEFLAGKVGSTGSKEGDELLGELRMSLGMISSGVASLHGRAGANASIAKDIQAKMESGKMSYGLISGGLKELKKWTDKYGAKPGKGGEPPPPASDPYQEYLNRPKK